MVRFTSMLQSMPRGGHAVELDEATAVEIGGKHGQRVRGTFAAVEFRSNLVKMGGRLLLGVHTATVRAAGVEPGDTVTVEIRPDTDPRPTDVVPHELERALRSDRAAATAWERLSPSHRREYIGYIMEAKKDETRRRRVEQTIFRLTERDRR